jgi:hypothetical protein
MFYLVAVLLVVFLYDEQRAPHSAVPGKDERVTFRSMLAFENFIPADGSRLWIAVHRSQLRAGVAAVCAQVGTPVSRVPIVAGRVVLNRGGHRSHRPPHLWPLAPPHHGEASDRVERGGRFQLVHSSTCWRPARGVLVFGTPIFGIAIGIATTAAYTASQRHAGERPRGRIWVADDGVVERPGAEPIVNGILGATSIRAVFVLDTVGSRPSPSWFRA